MAIDPRKVWKELVAQAQVNIEAGDGMADDIVVIRMDVYVQQLEYKIANHYRQLDMAVSRNLKWNERGEIIAAQLAQEVMDEK